ncbi:Rab-GTPase-TBC domain [Phytophthora cactorum]|nr:Rab-GTPase-TBC domain [Phytophthora cactorum]
MGFLSAMFLCYMPEQQAFWLLVACLNHKRYGLADLYRPRMPKVPEVTFVFEGLFKQLMPQLSAHLENEGLHPTMYLTQWFLTLFTYNFPFEFVTRVWDPFYMRGGKSSIGCPSTYEDLPEYVRVYHDEALRNCDDTKLTLSCCE